MKEDRFLIAILVGIGVLILLSLVLFFMRRTELTYVSEDTPEGVVQNFIVALHMEDYERAYRYLADEEDKPEISDFRQPFLNNMLDLSNTSIKIGESTIVDGEAFVTVTVIRAWGDLLGELFRDERIAELVWESAAWKIRSMPDPYWFWDWNRPRLPDPIKPVVPGD
jgi:hypothetical protein